MGPEGNLLPNDAALKTVTATNTFGVGAFGPEDSTAELLLFLIVTRVIVGPRSVQGAEEQRVENIRGMDAKDEAFASAQAKAQEALAVATAEVMRKCARYRIRRAG